MAEAAHTRWRPGRFVTRQRVGLWATALLCVGWYLHGWQVLTPGLYTRGGDFKAPDYVQFYVMGSLLRHGAAASLYDATAHAREAQRRIGADVQYHAPYPNYGPQVAFAFAPLAALPFGWSLVVFSVLSVAAYGLAVWCLWRSTVALKSDPRLVAVVAMGNPALLVALRFGQLSTFSLLALALAVAAASRRRRFTTGICLGLLAFKPQLLIAAVPALALARDWRGLGGIAAAAGGQLAIGWYAAGIGPMEQYGAMLWNLALHPDLVVLFPDIAHSLRGFLRLLGAGGIVAGALPIAVLAAALPSLASVWRSDAPALLRVGFLVTVTLLVTPHLITYDLLLLAVPFMAAADWGLGHRHEALEPYLVPLLILLYFVPFSAIVAALTRVQLSTVVMALLALVLRAITRPPAAGGLPAGRPACSTS